MTLIMKKTTIPGPHVTDIRILQSVQSDGRIPIADPAQQGWRSTAWVLSFGDSFSSL